MNPTSEWFKVTGEVLFLFKNFFYINIQHIKIIVSKFEVDWSKTIGDMEL